MFILKLLVKIILLPVFLMVCFVRTWVEVLSRIGCVILGLFYLVMTAVLTAIFKRMEAYYGKYDE